MSKTIIFEEKKLKHYPKKSLKLHLVAVLINSVWSNLEVSQALFRVLTEAEKKVMLHFQKDQNFKIVFLQINFMKIFTSSKNFSKNEKAVQIQKSFDINQKLNTFYFIFFESHHGKLPDNWSNLEKHPQFF